MTNEVFQSHGGGQAVLREKKIVAQDTEGNDIVTFGRLDDGTHGLVIADADGVSRVRIGNLGDGHYGRITYDAAGNELTREDERGIISPPLAVTLTQRTAGSQVDLATITSGSFSSTGDFLGRVPSFVHQGLMLRVAYSSDVGTTGEIQVQLLDASLAVLATSNAFTVASGSGGTAVTLRWLHGVSLPGPETLIAVSGRRTSGAGNVLVGRPYLAYFVGPDDMVAGGGAWS